MRIRIDRRCRRHERARPEIYAAAWGFTLLELLVVIAILTVLGGLILPAVARTKGEARSIICRSHARQLTFAWLMYASDYPHAESRFPESVDKVQAWKSLGAEAQQKLMWDNAVRFYGEP